jgi:hypothetical protein
MAGSMKLGTRNLLSALRLGAAGAIVAGVVAVSACANEQPKKLPSPDTAAAATSASTKARAASDSAKNAALGGMASPLEAPVYVGTRYDPLPPGISYEGGAVLMGANGKPSAFALTHVLTPRGNYMWLDSILPGDGQSQLRKRIVRGEMRLRPAATNEVLLIGSCEVHGNLDASVVGFAEREFNKKRLAKIHEAWRANPATGRFEVLPPKDVVCEDPGI